MTKGLALSLMSVFALLTILAGADGIALATRLQDATRDSIVQAVQQHDPNRAVQPFVSLIEWLKVIGGVVGMVLGILGVWVYYRTTIRTKTNEALSATVDIYKGQIDALMSRDEQRERDLKESLAAMAEREKEVAALRARTDLSEVLKGVQLLAQVQTQTLKESTKDHETLVSTLTVFMKNSEERYQAALKFLSTSLETSQKTAAEAAEYAKENSDFLQALIRATDAISRRLGGVENTVEAVAQATGAEKNGERAKQADAGAESTPERRRRPR